MLNIFKKTIASWKRREVLLCPRNEILFAWVKSKFIETKKNGVPKNCQYLTENLLLTWYLLIIIITLTNTFRTSKILNALARKTWSCCWTRHPSTLRAHFSQIHSCALQEDIKSSLPFAMTNRPFPISLQPLFQSESKCEIFCCSN